MDLYQIQERVSDLNKIKKDTEFFTIPLNSDQISAIFEILSTTRCICTRTHNSQVLLYINNKNENTQFYVLKNTSCENYGIDNLEKGNGKVFPSRAQVIAAPKEILDRLINLEKSNTVNINTLPIVTENTICFTINTRGNYVYNSTYNKVSSDYQSQQQPASTAASSTTNPFMMVPVVNTYSQPMPMYPYYNQPIIQQPGPVNSANIDFIMKTFIETTQEMHTNLIKSFEKTLKETFKASTERDKTPSSQEEEEDEDK